MGELEPINFRIYGTCMQQRIRFRKRDQSWTALIRGYNQEWSLAPSSRNSFLCPSGVFLFGNLSGRVDFASWLGQNSKQQKYHLES